MSRARACLGAVLAGWTAFGAVAHAEGARSPLYRVPRGPLGGLADVPGPPSAEVAPDGRSLVVLERPALPPLARLADDTLRLAADLWVTPAARASQRPRWWSGLRLVSLPEGGERPVVGLPAAPRLGEVAFSPDGRTLAFTHTGSDGVELWLVDVKSARARRVPRLRLSGVFAPACSFLPDGRALICRAVPTPAPPVPTAPEGPSTQETPAASGDAGEAPSLAGFDTRLFEALALAQAVRVRLDGSVSPLGAPAVLRRVEPSPDGRRLLVEVHHAPYVFTLPTTRFARRVEVWDEAGPVLARVADLDLARALPAAADAVRAGPREFSWRADVPATLVWSEAERGPEASDRLLALAAPFDGAARVLARGLRGRVGEIEWLNDAVAVAVTESQAEGRLRRYVFAPGAIPGPGDSAAPRLIDDVAFGAADVDAGTLATTPAPWRRLLSPDAGSTLYVLRAPANDVEPSVDRFEPRSGRATTLWRARAPWLERPMALLDPGGTRLLTRREAVDEPPVFALRDLAAGTLRVLTRPAAARLELPAVRHEVLHAARPDGVALEADVTLPAAWTPARGALPVLVWIYPEARSRAAGRSSGPPGAYAPAAPLDPRVWAHDGYAVLEPALPIGGAAAESDDVSFVAQVVAGVEAAVDELARRGLADPRRVALGGHSFGASMAALVLARTDRFRCGVVLSGAFNRTLTPFGFQSERRTLWRAPQVYLGLSPLMQADRIRAPLLLIHGQADAHPATPPEQSQRMYEALRGLGARARLVLLPHEGHNVRGRESTLHVLAEIQEWLARWLGAPPSNVSAHHR